MERSEFDQLIGSPLREVAATPDVPPPSGGMSRQEFDALIQGIPAKASPPADLSGMPTMGSVGVEGLQLGQVTPEIAATPKVLPGVPSQAAVMGQEPGTQSPYGEPVAGPVLPSPRGQTVEERLVATLGPEAFRAVQPPEPLSPADVRGALAGSVMQPGRTPLEHLSTTPERLQESAARGFSQGLPGKALEALRTHPVTYEPEGVAVTGAEGARAVPIEPGRPRVAVPQKDVYYDPTLVEQSVEALTSLADPVTALFFLMTGAVGAVPVRAGVDALVKKFGEAAVGQAYRRLAQGVGAGMASFASYDAVTNALEQSGAIARGEQEGFKPGETGQAAARGAVLGGLFGVAGMAPAAILRKAAEIGILASVPPTLEGRTPTARDVLDAGVLVGTLTAAGKVSEFTLRSLRKPATERTPEEGRAIEQIPGPIQEEIAREVIQKVVAPQETPPQAEETPLSRAMREDLERRGERPATTVFPDYQAILAKAQEASQRLEAAVKRAEDLAAKAPTPPPLEVPPEVPPAAPGVPKAEIPTRPESPPPAEVAPLPAGRIAESAPQVTLPVPQVEAPVPQVEPPTPPRRPELPPPPVDELAALRRELNPEIVQREGANVQRGVARPAGQPPEAWLMGATQQRERAGMSPKDALADAVRTWHDQEALQRQFESEQPPERPAFREAPREAAPPFFSQLQREIDKRLPARATPEQIRNIVASGAVKADEVKWSGLEDYLATLPAGQMVDKADLQRFLRENEVRVEEVTLRTVAEGEVTPEERATIQPPKFARFTLPGGEQYRELLLTLPTERTDLYRSPHFDEPNVLAHVRFNDRTDARGKKVLFIEELQSDWHQEGRRKGYQIRLEDVRVQRNEEFGTWEAIAPDGRKAGGYKDADQAHRVGGAFLVQEGLRIPSAPFAKTWHELVLKRMLRWAAERGYDKLAWTTGEHQAERYDLSKHIKRLVYEPALLPGAGPKAFKNEGYHLRGELPNGNVHDFGLVARDNLADTVGKDVADKIIAGEGRIPAGLSAEGTRQRFLEGVDLKVGGEGMRAFYDQMLPQFLNKYGKKWGARVGDTTIQTGQYGYRLISDDGSIVGAWPTMREAFDARKELLRDTGRVEPVPDSRVRVPSLDITPEMRRSVVQEGQPMFMAGRRAGEADAAWGRRWMESLRASLKHGVRIEGELFLTDTWSELPGRELEKLARDAVYLRPIAREAKSLFSELHQAIQRDFPEFTGADLFAFDTGFGEAASLIPAGGVTKSTRPQMVLNPYSLLEEARGLATLEGQAVLPIFGRQVRESLLHEFAHAFTKSPDHDAAFDAVLTDLQQRYGTVGQAEINRLAATLRGYHYEQFANDTARLSVSGVEPGRPSPGPGAPPSPAPGAAFGQPQPPGSPGLARSVEPAGTRPAGGVGGREGVVPTPPSPAGAGRTVGAEPPSIRGIEPARREAGQPPEPRPDLTDRVAEAGKKFPREDFARWAESMRGALGPGVEPYLRPAWDKIQGVEARSAPETPPPPPPEPPVSPPSPPRAEEPTGAPPEGPPPLEEPRLKLEYHKQVVDAAGEMFERAGIARDKDRWPVLSDQILDAMREGTLDLPTMQDTLRSHGLTLVEFGESMFRPAVKNAAQRLQMLSVLQRRLNRMAVEAGRGSEADALLNLAQQVETLRREGGDEAPLKELSWWRRADNVRRGLLVTQLATAVRNFETQMGRLGIDVLDQATQRVFGGTTANPWAAWESFTDALSQIRPTKGGAEVRKVSQGQVDALLQVFPKEWDRLFGTYSADIARQARETSAVLKGADAALTHAEKVVHVLNFFNRFQEFAVRRSVFWNDLASRLERRGIDVEALARGERRLSGEEWDAIGPDVKASVQKALEMTFAQNAPYGSLGWHFVQAVNKLPLILSGPLPFPRFMVNSLKFLYEFSPMPFLKLLSAPERAKIAAGDTKLLSRASIGTAALLGAWLVREMQPDDNKWNEVNVPGLGTTDIRPFNPFAAYFFLGELAKRTRTGTRYRMDWKDIARGVASANVSGGLGLFALDKMIAGLGELSKPGKTMEAAKQAGGEVLSGLLVPLRTLTDLYAQFDPEWQVVRERRGEPFLGPAKSQLGMGEPLARATRAEPQTREAPALRQLTGVTKVTEKNDLERELDRLQFSRQEIHGPSTGDPVADNLVAKYMGELAESQTLPKLAGFPYQGLSDAQKMEWLRRELTRVRAIARARAKRENPDLFREVKEGLVPSRRRLLNLEREEQGLAPARGR